jgi:flavin-dependent dehydrogenase
MINFGVGGLYTRRALEQAFRENLKLFDLRLTRSAVSPRTSACLIGGPSRILRKGKLVVAGEAAGAVMSTTGEGIRFALWSGSICFKPDYEGLFWGGYGERLKFGARLLKLVLRLSDQERLGLLRRGTPKLQGNLLEGIKPSVKDVVAMPWLLPYLKKLYAVEGG